MATLVEALTPQAVRELLAKVDQVAAEPVAEAPPLLSRRELAPPVAVLCAHSGGERFILLPLSQELRATLERYAELAEAWAGVHSYVYDVIGWSATQPEITDDVLHAAEAAKDVITITHEPSDHCGENGSHAAAVCGYFSGPKFTAEDTISIEATQFLTDEQRKNFHTLVELAKEADQSPQLHDEDCQHDDPIGLAICEMDTAVANAELIATDDDEVAAQIVAAWVKLKGSLEDTAVTMVCDLHPKGCDLSDIGAAYDAQAHGYAAVEHQNRRLVQVGK